jgi:DNA-binding CsgD family transcriptional regulator
MLAARDGLRSAAGLLRADCEATDAALGAMIAQVQAASGGHPAMQAGILRVSRPSGRGSYAVRVSTAPRAGGPVLVFVERPRSDLPFDLDDAAGPGSSGMRAGRKVHLSQRERQCLEGVAQGRTTKQIARGLHLSADTVDEHIGNARHKLGARTRAEAVAIATSSALLSTPPTEGGRRNRG